MNWFQKQAVRALRLNLPYGGSGYANLDDSHNLGWTPLTVGQRDLPTFQQDRMFEIASFLYRRNAIAHRVIEIIKSFVVGEGIVIKAREPKIDSVIQKFWKNRRNNWRKYLRDRVVSHSLYGEALMPAYINPVDGSVLLGSAHPGIIERVLPNARNNFEAEQILIKSGRTAEGTEVAQQLKQVIKTDTDPESESFLRYNGDMFFFAINKPMDTLRGISDLYSIADWLDIYDQFMFNRAERQSYINTFLWDITLEGASPSDIDKKTAEMILREQKIRSGKFYVHNEKEKRQAISPDLHSDDAVNDAQSFMNMILGGTGLSAQAFGDPSGAGRQASGDVNEWVFKTLSDRQFVWRDTILEILDFVIDQAELHNTISQGLDRFIEVFMPKISVRDLQRLTQALRNTGNFAAQVERASTVLVLDDADKKRIKAVMHSLLDHIDQSSGLRMIHDVHDVLTLNKPTQESLDAMRKENGHEKIQGNLSNNRDFPGALHLPQPDVSFISEPSRES